MDRIHICGGQPLYGECRIQGSKNAVLPILAATVLVDGITTLDNCPQIADVSCMLRLLESIGCVVHRHAGQITVDARELCGSRLPEAYVTRMRSSVILMGALLGRCRSVSIAYPGGCVIGRRPIDMHLRAFAQLGVHLTEWENGLTAWAKELRGGEITLDFPSVGATENSILAAVLAEGETKLRGAAREPEIAALCEFLSCAGAVVEKNDTGDEIRICGVQSLHSCRFRIPPDRIVTGTYLLGCMAAGGQIHLIDTRASELSAVLEVIREMGGSCKCEASGIRLQAPERPKAIPHLKTAVYPGYPTDLQSPLLAVLARSEGESCIEEAIFENRFRVVPQLEKLGADIQVENNLAVIRGKETLRGACVRAQELRGGAALCLAALAAKGDSYIADRHYIDRGYEALERDIRSLGGRI